MSRHPALTSVSTSGTPSTFSPCSKPVGSSDSRTPRGRRCSVGAPEDLDGKNFIDLVHPDDVAQTWPKAAAEWSDGSPTRTGFENRSAGETEPTAGSNGRPSDGAT